MAERILVAFEGEGSGVEELTWGQIGFWQGVEDTGKSPAMGGVTALPPGTGIDVAHVVESLRFVTGRHQSLRTRLRFDEPGARPKQVCVARGEVPLLVVDVGPDGDADAVAKATEKDFEERNFDYEHEFPLRMAAIRRGGEVTHIVAVYSHLAIDATALTVLMDELAARDPVTGAAAAPVTAMQPLEQARRQREPAALRQSAASLRYLEHVFRTVTPDRFGEPKHARNPDEPYRVLRYLSPAAALAVRRIALQENVDTSTVLLGVFAIGLARFTGNSPVMTMLLVGNRFRPRFGNSVSPLVQLSPYMIDVADVTLREAVDRARVGVLNTYKNAYYDPYAQDAVIERVNADRGQEVDFDCFYNDRRQQDRSVGDDPPPTGEQIHAALALARPTWAPADVSTRKLFFSVSDPPGGLEFEISVDTRYFSADDMVTVARGIEEAAVQTALEPGLPTGVRLSTTSSAR